MHEPSPPFHELNYILLFHNELTLPKYDIKYTQFLRLEAHVLGKGAV